MNKKLRITIFKKNILWLLRKISVIPIGKKLILSIDKSQLENFLLAVMGDLYRLAMSPVNCGHKNCIHGLPTA